MRTAARIRETPAPGLSIGKVRYRDALPTKEDS